MELPDTSIVVWICFPIINNHDLHQTARVCEAPTTQTLISHWTKFKVWSYFAADSDKKTTTKILHFSNVHFSLQATTRHDKINMDSNSHMVLFGELNLFSGRSLTRAVLWVVLSFNWYSRNNCELIQVYNSFEMKDFCGSVLWVSILSLIIDTLAEHEVFRATKHLISIELSCFIRTPKYMA